MFLQSYGLFKQGRIRCINFSVPEVKILILLSYFIILGIMSLVNFSVSLNEANPLLDDFVRYFTCQLGGFNPMCEDIRRQFRKHLKPELNGVTYFLTGLIPWVYLMFTVQGENVKRLFQRIRAWYHQCCPSAKVFPSETKSTSDKSAKSSTNP